MSSSIETLPILTVLEERFKAVKLVTNLDSKTGRGQQKTTVLLKQEAIKKKIPVFQSNDLRADEEIRVIREFQPQIILTADFSRILHREILKIPSDGCLNIHPSLLPKYRGPNPIAEAILRGDSVAGISIFLMSQIIDGGEVLFQKTVPILQEETTQTLKKKVFKEISKDLIKVILKWKEKKIIPIPQEEKQASYTQKYSKKDGEIDWSLSAQKIERRIRAFFPWPGAWTLWNGKQIKILKARPLFFKKQGKKGEIFLIKEDNSPKVGIICGTNVLEIEVLQLEGKKDLLTADFIRGQRDFLGDILGKN